MTAYTGKWVAQQPANRLYRNLGGKGFANILPAGSGLYVADHGVQRIDYDRDGALDQNALDQSAKQISYVVSYGGVLTPPCS